MSGSRQAALALHALDVADRSWILDRLDPGQRESVDPLLAELSELSIPVDDGLLRDALATPRRDAAARRTTREEFAALSVPQATRLLADEPAGLIARLLTAGTWGWTAGYLQSLDESRRRALAEAMRDAPRCASPQLEEWLIEDLVARAREGAPATPEAPEGTPDVVPAGRLRRLFARLGVAR